MLCFFTMTKEGTAILALMHFQSLAQLSGCHTNIESRAILAANLIHHITLLFYSKGRLKGHKCQERSALYRHGEETQHEVDFQNPIILDKDTIKTRLLIKESLHIQDSGARKSLNRNLGSFELRLW